MSNHVEVTMSLRSPSRGKLITLLLAAALTAALPAAAQQQRVLRLISDRTDQGTLRPILDAFEQASGAKVEGVFMDQGLVNRLESRPTEADVVITKDAELMEIAAERGLLARLESPRIKAAVPAQFVGTNDMFYVDAYRARVIFYSRERVKPSELSTYADLASPKWKGRICIRSGSHDYNLALFGQFIASYGEDEARRVIGGIAANLARKPQGNDREQARGIHEGKCDVALMNTYYHPLMQGNPAQKAWADSVGVFFPDQAGKGTFIMRSAVGVTKAKGNRDLALQLAEFMVSREAQELMVNRTRQYSVLPDVPVHPQMVSLGAEQGLTDGRFKMDFVPLAALAGKREVAIRLVDSVGFDSGF
ncbi:extracellular solute-binding protein [Rubrivivax albus]|nr:extracellular solute-binding protein [Rubrivivax albus]